TALLVSASPGALGGMRALVHLRSILGNIGTLVLPSSISIIKAHEAFDGQQLKDPTQRAKLEAIASEFVEFLRKHYPQPIATPSRAPPPIRGDPPRLIARLRGWKMKSPAF